MTFFAHRAGSFETIGNTLSGVLRCFALGINIEIDVKQCADALVCTHYDELGSDKIGAFPLMHIRKYRYVDSRRLEHHPFDVDGGIACRIPSLLEVLAAAKHSPAKPLVLLDIKEAVHRNSQTERMIKNYVQCTGTHDQVLYGIHQRSELEAFEDRLDKVLAFTSPQEFSDFCASGVGWIRVWQSWLEDEDGQLTDPRGYLNSASKEGRQFCIMTGAPNHAAGGVCTFGQLKRLQKLGASGAILNDPSLCLQAENELVAVS